MNIETVVQKQRMFFNTGATLDIEYRINSLKKLYSAIRKYEDEIYEALRSDLNKSDYESYMCEIGLTLSEISYMLKHIKNFTKKHIKRTPLSQFHAITYTVNSPYGNILIISPWNYPFLLSLEPLADALAAGNTAIIKPSEYSYHTSCIVEKIISECFDEEYVAVISGGVEVSRELLKQKFDLIFFTGSTNVGKEVYRSGSENLTPVILELGGKSPCIVEDSADIKLAAKRIVFGKFLNAGQTCVAPDYILCHKKIHRELIEELIKEIKLQYADYSSNPDYVRIINERHFNRLLRLTDKLKTVYGGRYDYETLKIEPTLMDNVTFDDMVMEEEIFGPVLPVIEYDSYDDLYDILLSKPSPLALYIFSSDQKHIDDLTHRINFGGSSVNDTVIHLASSETPFGGVGNSGMGSYHGKYGFDAFSHTKTIVRKYNWIDLPMRYQPYNRQLYSRILKFFLK